MNIQEAYNVNVIGVDDKNIILRNYDEVEVSIPIELLRLNNISTSETKVHLTTGLYQKHFVEEKKRLNHIASEAFYHNLPTILRNRDTVLSNPEFFHIRADVLYCGAAFISGYSYSLGALLECWSTSDDLKISEDYHMVTISGSPFSGAFASLIWSDDKNQLMAISSRRGDKLPKNFLWYWKVFKELHIKHPERLISNHLAIQKLINSLAIN